MRIMMWLLVMLIASVFNVNAQAGDFDPLLNPNLTIIGTNDGVDDPGETFAWPVDVVFNGEQYLAVWAGRESGDATCPFGMPCSDIYGRLISPSGQFITEPFEISVNRATSQLWPSVASNGTTFLVVWIDHQTNLAKGQLVTRSGDLLDGEITISPLGSFAIQDGVDVASDGTDYIVVWTKGGNTADISGQRIKENGDLEGSPFVITEDTNTDKNPSITYGGGKYFVTWEHTKSGDDLEESDLYGAIIDASTGNVQSFPVATGESCQGSKQGCGWGTRPNGTAFDGTYFIAIWRDDYKDGGVYARRVTVEGQPLDGPLENGGIPVSSGQSGAYPQITFDGSNWLAIWTTDYISGQGYTTNGARINQDGTVQDPDPITFLYGNDSAYPSVASDSINSLIAWDSGPLVKAQLFGTGVPRASADIPFLNMVGNPVSMNAAYSFSPNGNPLTYYWEFGDGSSQSTLESIVLHTYSYTGIYTVELYVNDGLQDSMTFKKTIAISGSSGGGQQNEVDQFLSYIDPPTKTTSLPADPSGTTSYSIKIVYGQTIDPNSFQVSLNGDPINMSFHPAAGKIEEVTITPLLPGRNTLKLSVEGIKLPSHIAKDQDTLIFKVE